MFNERANRARGYILRIAISDDAGNFAREILKFRQLANVFRHGSSALPLMSGTPQWSRMNCCSGNCLMSFAPIGNCRASRHKSNVSLCFASSERFFTNNGACESSSGTASQNAAQTFQFRMQNGFKIRGKIFAFRQAISDHADDASFRFRRQLQKKFRLGFDLRFDYVHFHEQRL